MSQDKIVKFSTFGVTDEKKGRERETKENELGEKRNSFIQLTCVTKNDYIYNSPPQQLPNKLTQQTNRLINLTNLIRPLKMDCVCLEQPSWTTWKKGK